MATFFGNKCCRCNEGSLYIFLSDYLVLVYLELKQFYIRRIYQDTVGTYSISFRTWSASLVFCFPLALRILEWGERHRTLRDCAFLISGLRHIQLLLSTLRVMSEGGRPFRVSVLPRRIHNIRNAHDELRQLDRMETDPTLDKIIVFDLSSEEAYRLILRQVVCSLLLLRRLLMLPGTRGTRKHCRLCSVQAFAFMDHPCTLGAAVCQQEFPCPFFPQSRARRTNGLKLFLDPCGIRTDELPLASREHHPLVTHWVICSWQFSYMSQNMTNQQNGMCAQPRHIWAWASAQSDQSRWTQAFFMRTAKTLIRLGGCPGWPESSLGAHAILLVLSCAGSYNKTTAFTRNIRAPYSLLYVS